MQSVWSYLVRVKLMVISMVTVMVVGSHIDIACRDIIGDTDVDTDVNSGGRTGAVVEDGDGFRGYVGAMRY